MKRTVHPEQPIRLVEGTETLESERELIERARREPDAFGALFDRYHDAIFGYLLHRTAHVTLAHELTSNTFFKAMSRLDRFRWRRLPFSAWLYRIASNEVADHHRARRCFPTETLDRARAVADPAVEADREIIEAEKAMARDRLFSRLHRAISRLSLKYQEAIVLCYFERKSVREIGAITGVSEGTVKARLHRARARLRSLLEDAHGEMEMP
jgi:RNA polymerase sigma-70 factor (ECF subfamily)